MRNMRKYAILTVGVINNIMNEITEEIIKMLADISDEKINEDIVEQIVKSALPVEFGRGDVIITGDKSERYIYYIISGAVRSYYIDQNGNDITWYFNVENQIVMGENLFNFDSGIHTYEAMENSKMLRFDAYELRRFILADNSLSKVYIRFLEEALNYKISRENSLLSCSATERYIEFKKLYPTLEGRVNQYHIASYLGITPESLSRIRRNLRKEIQGGKMK